MKLKNFDYLLFIIEIILYFILVNANNGKNLNECEKNEKNICIMKDNTKLSNGQRCISHNGDVFESTNNGDGSCKLMYKLDEIYEMLVYSQEKRESGEFAENIYKLFNDDKCTIPEDENKFGYLCYCENDNNCEYVKEIGYFINDKDNIYSCPKNENKCTKISSGVDCSNGELIYDTNDNTKISFCISNEGSPVLLSADNIGNYIVDHKEGNIFGSTNSEQFSLVKINQNSVVLDKSFRKYLKFIYADKITNKVLDKGICPNGSINLIELNCDEYAICTENH